ncbi:MAG: hypothetical protein QME96_10895 [Myxococcota bacterium]|nr:hypothetical protein [Myxococcota bacterium]
MRRALAATVVVAACLAGCTEVGYFPIRTGVAARSQSSIRLFVGRDVGRPYEPLGYVYFAPMVKGDGLHDIGDDVAEFDPSDRYYQRFLALAAGNGADAIVDLLRAGQPAVHLDIVEATWRAWSSSADPPAAPLLAVARQVLDGCLNPATANGRLILPDLRGILTMRARDNNSRPPPGLRNYPAGSGGS